MDNYRNIAIKYLKENKKRTILTILGIALSVALIFAIGTFIPSMKVSGELSMREAYGDYEYIYDGKSIQLDKLQKNAEVIYKGHSVKVGEGASKDSDYNITIEAYDIDAFNNVFKEEIIEGRKPSKAEEIIVDKSLLKLENKKIGDKVRILTDAEDKEYTIVGAYKPKIIMTGRVDNIRINCYTFLDYSKVKSDDKVKLYVNLKSLKRTDNLASNIGSKYGEGITVAENRDVLMMSMSFKDDAIYKTLIGLGAIVIVIVMIATISVIYNSFNISAVERIRYFGILKAAGATKRQISNIVFREGTIMGLIAIPIGIICGYLGLKFVAEVILKDGFMMFYKLKIFLYPTVILITVILTYITILLSARGAAKIAARVNIIDAIRNTNQIKKEKIKKRRSGLLRVIFGPEGELGYKNIRRNNKRFIITVFALTLSMVMFNVFYNFMGACKESVKDVMGVMPIDFVIASRYKDTLSKEDVDKILALDGIKSFNVSAGNEGYIPIESKFINKDYNEKMELALMPEAKYNQIGESEYSLVQMGGIETADRNGINLVNKSLKDKKLTFEELDDYGVIITDEHLVSLAGVQTPVRFTNLKVGDKIKIPKIDYYKERKYDPDKASNSIENSIENNEFVELTVLGITSDRPMSGGRMRNGIAMTMTEKAYREITGATEYSAITGEFASDEGRDKIYDYFLTEATEYSYQDVKGMADQINQMYNQMSLFVYIFISVITVISTVNILNTITTNMLVRVREFSTFRAVGMTSRQMKKMILFEGALYGITSFVIGGIISIGLLKLMEASMMTVYDSPLIINYMSFFISGIVTVLISFCATVIPLKKITKTSIVEGIRGEE